MPLPDGKITMRLDDNEAQVLFWALVSRVRQLSDDRRAAEGQAQEVIEAEIIQLGGLLERLPTYNQGRI